MSLPIKVLVVDDDAGVRFTLREVLQSAGMTVSEAEDGQAALEMFEAEPFDLVVTDLRMPRMDGMALLQRLSQRAEPPRLIVITAHGSEREAVEAMKSGAYDYFRKPFDIDELVAVVNRALESVRLRRDNERLASELNLSRSMVFRSEAMSRLAVMVQRIAPRDVTILIAGESGTGKERIAEAIVRASKRADAPYLRFNCAALTAELAEAELFGHAKGAFTGAVRERAGLFREASGGTLLLDEIGELDASLQAKLLRVLQEGEVRPVGEDRAQKVDVRIIAATHRDLKRLVAEGRFRDDLYYRLNVVNLRVPPLRERPEDIPLLTQHFLDKHTERFGMDPMIATPELVQRLTAREWPGNVRELENMIESLVALSSDGRLDLSLLDEDKITSAAGAVPARGLKARVEAYERALIVEALETAKGNRSEAARLLDIGRATLHDKLKKYGLADEKAGSSEE